MEQKKIKGGFAMTQRHLYGDDAARVPHDIKVKLVTKFLKVKRKQRAAVTTIISRQSRTGRRTRGRRRSLRWRRVFWRAKASCWGG